MHVRWDEGAAATPHGQLVFFAEFLAATGVFERWVSSCPLEYRSGNAPDKRDVLGTLMLGLLGSTGRRCCWAASVVRVGQATQPVVNLLRDALLDSFIVHGLTFDNMSTLLVSSKGQIVMPAEMRRRLGMGAGARIEVLEESDGLKLRVVRSVATADMTGMAGMVKAPARGVPRRLEDFDPASLLTRSRRSKP